MRIAGEYKGRWGSGEERRWEEDLNFRRSGGDGGTFNAGGEVLHVGSNGGGPGLDVLVELFQVAGEQGAGGFFKSHAVASKGGHEFVTGFQCAAFAVLAIGIAAGVFDQPAKRCRGTARLGVEPVPVSGEECDFAGEDADFGAARAA